MLSKKSGLHDEGSQPMPECNHVRPWSLPVSRQPSPAGHVTTYSGPFHGTMPMACLLLDMRSAASHAAAAVSTIHHPSSITHHASSSATASRSHRRKCSSMSGATRKRLSRPKMRPLCSGLEMPADASVAARGHEGGCRRVVSQGKVLLLLGMSLRPRSHSRLAGSALALPRRRHHQASTHGCSCRLAVPIPDGPRLTPNLQAAGPSHVATCQSPTLLALAHRSREGPSAAALPVRSFTASAAPTLPRHDEWRPQPLPDARRPANREPRRLAAAAAARHRRRQPGRRAAALVIALESLVVEYRHRAPATPPPRPPTFTLLCR